LGKGWSGRVFKLTLLTGVATSAGTFIGVRYGVTGAALGFSLGAAVMSPFYFLSLVRPVHLPISRMLSATKTGLLATGAMTCAVLMLQPRIGAFSPILQLVAAVGVGAAVFTVASVLIGGKQIRSDIEELHRKSPEEPSSAPTFWSYLPSTSKSQNPLSG
jgi:O-antigen/teichoic acid export membrane protein